ncbi:uncharacterized protein PFLUO_LOCUS1907 [Penicillium psychrofluorescens]|uniref:uncharacterized protein n=1 Tax=Penicillium psychrofluorescens TaxID=3158075 RepID=UPI003CCD5C2B
MVTPLPPLIFEPNALYLLLLDRGDTYLFHWQLYLSTSPHDGITYHVNNEASPTAWEFESCQTISLPTCSRLLLALQVGVLEPMLHAAMGERLKQVPLTLYSTRYREQLTSRVWVKEALFALDDEGYITLQKSVKDIEEEAKYLAMLNKSKDKRTVTKSTGYM